MASPADKVLSGESMAGSPPAGQRTTKRRRKMPGDSRPPPPARVAGSYQRSKVPTACMVCRARKTKCDNVRPVCGFCKTTGGDCRYDESERSRFDPASVAILQQLDDIKNLLHEQGLFLRQRTDDGTVTRESISHDLGEPGSASTGASYGMASPEERVQAPLTQREDALPPGGDLLLSTTTAQTTQHDFDRYASRVQTTTYAPISTEVMAYTTADMGIEAMLRWPVFQRKLTQLGIPRERSLIALLDDRPQDQDMGPKRFQGIETDRALSRPRVQELVENFLVNNNVKNPILEPTGLRAQAENFVALPLEHTPENCLMYIVLAIGCISTPLDDNLPAHHVCVSRANPAYALAEYYFHESQQRAGALTFAHSLLAAQCNFLTAVYLMYTMRILPAWKTFISAGSDCVSYFVTKGRVNPMPAAQGQGFRLNSHCEDGPLTSTSRALEDALYWSCLKSEIELRFEIGLPGSGINAIHYPHVFPSVPDMDDSRLCISRADQQLISPERDKEHLTHGWFFFLAEITLKRLMYTILQNRYRLSKSIFQVGANGRGNPDTVDPVIFDTAEYDLQLDQWMQLLPPSMQFSPTSTAPLGNILPWVLRGHRIDAVELLRFPAFASIMRPEYPMMNPAESPIYAAGDPQRQASHDPAKLSREYLLNATNRIDANADGVFHRHQGAWLTIRSCTRSALALLGTKLAIQEQRAVARIQPEDRRLPDDLLPPGWRRSVLLVQDMLRAWEPEGGDVSYLRNVVEGLLSLCHD